jgi:hypothetical protein
MTGLPPNLLAPRHVGPHRVEFEPPDTLHIHYFGDVTLEQFKVFDAMVVSVTPPTRVYLLRDAREGGLVTSEVRSYVAAHVDVTRIASMVTYGSSFQTRIVSTMMAKAVQHLKPESSQAEFFATEGEARAFITMHRELSKNSAL